MAFTALSPSDKKAFFSLLDEYFASRPGIIDREPQERPTATPPSIQVASKPGHRNHQSEPIAGPRPSSPPHVPVHHSTQTPKLATQRKFGDVDMSSGKNMFGSLRHSTANKSAVPPPVAPPIPSAFAPKKNAFSPPPLRHVPIAEPGPEPTTEARQDSAHAKEGDWAEALYDYGGEDAGDLPLHDGQRVLVVERTSDDWWTGESDGRRGLFPASYIKMV